MKIVYVSNFMNHHQLPISMELYKNLGNEYKFIALERVPAERLSMGYEDMNHKYPFVIAAYNSEEVYRRCMRLIQDCDVLLVGSAPNEIMEKRLKRGKVTIKCSERYFKEGNSWVLFPRYFYRAMKHIRRFQKYPLYYLCSSAYTAADVNAFSNFRGRTFKWGYFPEVRIYENIEDLIVRKNTTSILWVARFIELKHPDVPIRVAKKLKSAGYQFEMNLIGNGELVDSIRSVIKEEGLEDCVNLLGAMSPKEVRNYMESTGIFMFTSDFNEGWGAVMNESMNSGCAVVASHAVGSVPFLLKDGENGLIYKNGDIDDLYNKVELLIRDIDLQRKLGREAYRTMTEVWNAKNAANRLITLLQQLSDGVTPYKEGPCSNADILKNGWYK